MFSKICNKQIKRFLGGLVVAAAFYAPGYGQSLATRQPEICESRTAEPQAGSLIDRELAARAEQRAEALWSKRFEIQMQEMDLQRTLEDLDYRMTPEGIQRALWFVGSARPMDEFREALRSRLESEKARITRMLEMLESTRERLDAAIRDADAELERVRQRLSSAQ